MRQKEQLIADLSALLGPKNVLTDATALSVYECDAAPSFKAMPDVVVFADTAQQVSDIVKFSEPVRHTVYCTRWRNRFKRWYALCSGWDYHRAESDGSHLRDRPRKRTGSG